jgi:signal transduction histidine kinase/uncharacterized membrane protein YqaE (UPF0057 family)
MPARLPQAAVPAAAAASAIAAAVVIPRVGAPLRTYGGASTAAHVLDVTAGLALVGAGCIAWSQARLRRTALLALLAGVVWFAPDWEGWEGGPTAVRSLGVVIAALFPALVVHLAVGFRGRIARTLTLAGYTVAGVVAAGWAVARDPFADPGCWRYCGANTFLVHADAGLALGLRDVWLRAAIALGLASAAVVVARRAIAAVPAALLALADAAYAGALLRTRLEDPRQPQLAALFDARAVAATLVAAGVVWRVAEARRARAAVSRLAAELRGAPPPGALAERLAATLGDPRLEVAYWLPRLNRYVDGDGRRVEPPLPGNGRVATPVVRGGDPVAVVVHDPALLDGDRLAEEIGASGRLALDNERLHAEVVARLGDLRASRTRIVEAADAERRRLERDLHDGAQQRLLALSFDLRLAAAAATERGETRAAELLTSAVDETQLALDELRDLARGIFPAVLTESGLGAALATLADAAPIPVTLATSAVSRYPAAVETTAYVAVVDAIDDAAAGDASFLEVRVADERDRLVVLAEHDGAVRTSAPTHLADRVGALGGTVEAGRQALRVEIPCA